jgi:hypothetical protein
MTVMAYRTHKTVIVNASMASHETAMGAQGPAVRRQRLPFREETNSLFFSRTLASRRLVRWQLTYRPRSRRLLPYWTPNTFPRAQTLATTVRDNAAERAMRRGCARTRTSKAAIYGTDTRRSPRPRPPSPCSTWSRSASSAGSRTAVAFAMICGCVASGTAVDVFVGPRFRSRAAGVRDPELGAPAQG